MKWTMSYEYVTFLNIYATDNRAPKAMKQKPSRSNTEIHKSTITVRYFNSILLENDKGYGNP